MMATLDRPLTRQEFREDILPHLATKADLSNLRAELRGDLLKAVLGMAGLQIVAIGVMAGLFKLLS